MEMVIGKKITRWPSNGIMKMAKCHLAALGALFCGCPLMYAQAFTFEIGSPVAAQDFHVKGGSVRFPRDRML